MERIVSRSEVQVPSARQIEQWLCESIASRLRIKDVDPEHPLGSYGLNSMEALRLLDRLERWLGEQLPATLFYEYPNIRELSRALAEGTVTESADYVAPDADAYG